MVPLNRFYAGSFNSRRIISTPLISSPCIAALINRRGPVFLPLITCTGMVTGVCVYKRPAGRSTVVRVPLAKVVLFMVRGLSNVDINLYLWCVFYAGAHFFL